MGPFLSRTSGAQGTPKQLTTHPKMDTLWVQRKFGHFCSLSTLLSSFAFEFNSEVNSKLMNVVSHHEAIPQVRGKV